MRFNRVAQVCLILLAFLGTVQESISQVCSLSQIPTNLQNGLVAYYTFCGNANDISGNGNNGSVNGATLTTDRFGNASMAYNFNGSNNDIRINLNSINNNFSSGASFSICAWVKTADLNGPIVSLRGAGLVEFNIGTLSDIVVSPGKIGVMIRDAQNCCGSGNNTFGTTVSNNAWRFLTMTRNGSNGGVVSIYVDGVLVAQSPGDQNGSLSFNNNQMSIGSEQEWIQSGFGVSSDQKYFQGVIDDVMIYSRVLGVCEIQQLFNGNSTSIPLSFNSLQDTTRVCGTTTTLNAGSGYSSYSWNTGAATQSISPTVSGFYKVTVTSSTGCTASDSTYLSLVKANIINNDTTICLGNSIRLSIDSLFPNRTACTSGQLPEPMRNGLLAYYPFCGNANNAMGTGNNGTVYNATLTTDRFGNSNSAYNFNGTNAYIDFGSNTSIGPTSTIPISISLWVSGGASGNVISKYTNLDASRSYFYFGRSANGYSWIGNGTNPYINNSGVSDAAWTHYVLVSAAGSNNSKVYRNGVLIATGTLALNSTMQAVSLLVGKVGASFPGFLNGKVDDIFIYNRILSASEIQNLYLYQPSVSWSTGATTNSIVVSPTQTTTYYVDVSDGVGTCRDSVTVTVSDLTSYNPLSDTTRICGTTTTLSAGSGYATYSWNTVATTQSISPTTSGFYRVTVTNAAGCTASDSTYLSLVNANIINRDTTICRGSSVTLSIDSLFPGRTSACSKFELPSNLQNGLIGYWPFCANPNNQASSQSNINVNQGVLTSDRFNIQNRAYYFNNTYGEATNIPITTNGNMTFSYWQKLLEFINGRPLIEFSENYSCNLNPQIYQNNQILYLSKCSQGSSGALTIGSGASILNQWVNVTWVVSGTATKLFLNGNLIGTSNMGWPTTSLVRLTLANGGNNASALHQQPANVILDDLMLYDRALSNSEVLQLYSITPMISWSTGATTNQITVAPTQTTTYYVTVGDGINSCTDSVRVIVSDIGTFNPLSDTTRVCGTSTVLNAGSGFSAYSWSNGSTSQSNTLTTSGFYRVTVTNAAGCTARDSTYLSLVNANIINRDTTICRGSSVTLSIDSLFPGRTACTASGLPASLSNGLVAYWPFCGNANDASGNNNNGQVLGPILDNDRFDSPNMAYRFNGSLDNKIVGSLNAPVSNNFTYSCWVKHISGNVPYKEWIFGFGTPTISNGSHLGVSNNIVRIGSWGLDGLGTSASFGQNWSHYVVTCQNGTYSIWQNGQLINSNLYKLTSIQGTDFEIGSQLGSITEAWNGWIDDVMLWNRVLQQSEITQLFTAAPIVTWSTGATTNQITVSPTQSTTYYLTVSDGVNTCTDSVRVNVSDIGTFNPLSDTTRVCGISTVLNAGSGYSTYNWSNGSTSQANTLTTGGFYRITVSNADGCTASDSTLLSLVNARIINNDTTICRSTPITLSVDSLFPGRTTCSAAGLPTYLRNGLVGYWPFCGNANDVSGSGNNGIINGALLTSDRFANQNSAYSFSNQQHIQLPSTFGFTSPTGNFTVSLWFRSNFTVNTEQYFLDLRAGNGNRITLYQHSSQGIGLHFSVEGPGGSAITPVVSISDYTNKWTHMIGVRKSDSIYLFLNGILVSQVYCQASQPYNFAQGVCGNCFGEIYRTIGGTDNLVNNQFTIGEIDDVQIWNRALTLAEITSISRTASVLWSTGATTNQITVTPTQSTTYYVTISDGITTCTDSVRITVAELDTAVVVLDPLQVCTNGGQVRIQAGVASGYQWLRNGVAIVGATSRLYTATQTGSYRVALVNSAGCRDTSRTISVSLYPQPVSGFSINPDTQCFAGNQFNFTNTTTLSSGTMTYLWNFGNGITSTQQNPTYSYPATGTYIVKLVATTGSGCKDSTTRTITVDPSPTATFSVNTASQCLTGNQFGFTNNSSITNGTITYAWTFGDGNVSTNANPTHSYSSAGTYTVKLVVTSAQGCKDSTTRSVTVFAKPTVDFSVNSLSQCVNGNSFVFTNNTTIGTGTVTYIWRFGDGNTATTANATYSYIAAGTYIVKLIAISDNGCADSTTQTVIVNPKPTVDFSVNNAVQCLAANQFLFSNLSTITAGTLTHAWTFGNGANSILTSPTYSYPAAGSYSVKLVSTSAEGCRDSITRSVTVHAMPSGTLNTPPTNLLCEGGIITLSATGGNTYQWFVNGGAIAGANSASYSASQPGIYTVNLVSLNGCIAPAAGAVTLQLVRKPIVNFTFDKYCAGFPTQFTDQSNTANSNVVSYNWAFGQGQGTSTLQNPAYTFPTASTYSVSLTVTPVACPSLATSVTKPVSTVTPPANQRYVSLNAVENRNLDLDARLFGGATYVWSPQTGLNNPTIQSPVFNHNAEVDYVITITTGVGCVVKDTQLVRIFKEKEIFVPKGFSPNGDGSNDKIFPRLVGVRTLTYFKVYNRWGQLIFMTTNENEGWDGTYKGVKQPMEGYVWIAEGIDIDNNTIKRTGTFLLLR